MKKNVLIIGKGGSLGEAIFNHLSELSNEYSVYGTTTKKENVTSTVFHLDIKNSESIINLPTLAFDHVIIAAGYEPTSNLTESTEEHINTMFKIHVIGPMLVLKHLQSKLAQNASVILFSSPAAWQGSYDPSYAAVKGAVNSLVRTLAKDFAPNIRVNALSPSLIESSTVYDGMTDDFKQRHIDRTLNKKLLTLPECVDAILFIMNAPHYTGQILHLNGGMIYGS